MKQEELIRASGIPYTIVRATQFFEFVGAIADGGTQGTTIRLPSAMMQPMAAEDVAELVAEISLGQPANGIVEIAGPEPIRMDELVRRYLSAIGDGRTVMVDESAGYFGTPVNDGSLTPRAGARLGGMRFGEWLARMAPQG
jgi:uncharacterized protein YbjT (DUF2867 family)